MLVEGRMTDRSSVEHCQTKLLEGYGYRNMDAYVDDINAPRRVVIFGRMHGITTKEKQNAVLWLYASPDFRGEDAFTMFKEMIESYEKVYPCDAWIASDWIFRGANLGMKFFLRRLGFEPQETVYCKLTAK